MKTTCSSIGKGTLLYKISFDAIVNAESDFQCKMCDSNFGRDHDALVTYITKKVCMKEEPVDKDDDGRFQCAQYPKISWTRTVSPVNIN